MSMLKFWLGCRRGWCLVVAGNRVLGLLMPGLMMGLRVGEVIFPARWFFVSRGPGRFWLSRPGLVRGCA